MKFSTRTTYGIRAMIDLAKEHKKKEVISLASIAKKEKISHGYLERLFSKLKKAELIISTKGKDGGYKLSRSPKKITLLDIVNVLEGKISPFHCLGEKGKVNCEISSCCGASKVLSKVQKAIIKTLKDIKLNDLI